MTDHAYVALIETPQQFDQVEDFVAALVREGAGYANDIGVLESSNHFDKGALLVLFTADRGLIDACFHLEFGFDGPMRFEHLDAFETEGDQDGAEIVSFRSLADEAGEQADTPEKVFAHVRALKGWSRGPRREAHADPVAYEEAADDWNRRLSEMLPVAAARRTRPTRGSTRKARKSAKPAGKPAQRPAKAAAKRTAKKPAGKPVKQAAKRTATAKKKSAGKPVKQAAKRTATAKKKPASRPAAPAAKKPAARKTAKAKSRAGAKRRAARSR